MVKEQGVETEFIEVGDERHTFEERWLKAEDLGNTAQDSTFWSES